MKNFALIAFCLFTMNSFAQWTSTNSPFNVGRYEDIFFLDETTGWTTNSDGEVYKTTDGLNWQLVTSFGEYCRSIEFATPQVGFCGTLESSLFKTTDGGQTWTDIAELITPQPPGICGLSIPSPNVIYGCGIFSSEAYVIKSTDQGATWTYIDLSAYASALVDIHFIDENRGFASGKAQPAANGGVILYTEDGGATWTVKHQTLFPQDYIWKIQSPDGIHYFGSIQSIAASENTRFVKSSDGGETWTTNLVSNVYSYTQTIGFVTPEHGWTGGGVNAFYETFDGGETWSLANLEGNSFNRFLRINENLAYMTGTQIFRYQDESIVGLVEDIPYQEIHKLTVSPNPADDKFVIYVELESKTNCELSVFDARGNLVQTVLSGRIGPLKEEIPVSVGKVAPQSLYVVLRTNEGLINRKVVKR